MAYSIDSTSSSSPFLPLESANGMEASQEKEAESLKFLDILAQISLPETENQGFQAKKLAKDDPSLPSFFAFESANFPFSSSSAGSNSGLAAENLTFEPSPLEFAIAHLMDESELALTAIELHLAQGGTVKFGFELDKILSEFKRQGKTSLIYQTLAVFAKDRQFFDLSIPDKINAWQLSDEEGIFEIAKNAISSSYLFCQKADRFPLKSEQLRFELANLALQLHKGRVLTNDFLQRFGISSFHYIESLAKTAARLGMPEEAVSAFNIWNTDLKRDLFQMGFEASPASVWKYLVTKDFFSQEEKEEFLLRYSQGPQGTLEDKKTFTLKIFPQSQRVRAEVLLNALGRIPAEDMSGHDGVQLLKEFCLPEGFDEWIELLKLKELKENRLLRKAFEKRSDPKEEFLRRKTLLWLLVFAAKYKLAHGTLNGLARLSDSGLIVKTLKLKSPSLKLGIIDDIIQFTLKKDCFRYFLDLKGKEFSKLVRMYLSLLRDKGLSWEFLVKVFAKVNCQKKGHHFFFREQDNQKALIRVLKLLISAESLDPATIEKILRTYFIQQDNPDQCREGLELLEIILAHKPESITRAETLSDLYAVLLEIFQEITGVAEREDFHKQYAETFGKFRNPMAILTWCSRLRQLNDPALMDRVAEFVDSVLTGTFREKRYAAEEEHLETVFASLTDETVACWMENRKYTAQELLPDDSEASDMWQGFTFEDTDDPCDLMLCGTDVKSCMNIWEDPEKNKALLALLTDGKMRMLAIKDPQGTIVARCILKMLWDNEKKAAVLFQEISYPYEISLGCQNLLDEMARRRAEALWLPLLTARSEWKEETLFNEYQGAVESMGSTAFYEYDDAVGEMTNGIYQIEHPYLAFDPLTLLEKNVEEI